MKLIKNYNIIASDDVEAAKLGDSIARVECKESLCISLIKRPLGICLKMRI
jgi:hypothetical protein